MNRLILVRTKGFSTAAAEVELRERDPETLTWKRHGQIWPARIGRNGLAWGWPAKAIAAARNEPVKREGDGKTPAGVFALDRKFGFSGETTPNYLRLETDQTLCIDDLRSTHYNTIVSAKVAGAGMSSEKMRQIPLYRRGYVVDFPTSREARGGSCIFIHLWRSAKSSTSGCVAISEDAMDALDAFIEPGRTAVALLPSAIADEIDRCHTGTD